MTAFDLAKPSGGKISVSAMNKILSVSGLSPSVLDKVGSRNMDFWVACSFMPTQQT